MAVILALNSTHRLTGASKTWYISDSETLDTEAGGAGDPAIPSLTSVSRLSSSISRTVWHEAQGISPDGEEDATATFDNSIAGPSGGPLDGMSDYVFNEHSAVLWIDGDRSWTGQHRGEPSFSVTTGGPSSVSSVLSRPRGPEVRLIPWIGIPTGVEAILASAAYATAPTNSAYDTPKFTVVCHWTGAIKGRVFRRTSGTNIQFEVQEDGVGNLIVRYSHSLGSEVVYSAAAPAGRPFHQLAFSVNSNTGIYRLMLNGEIVSSSASAPTPLIATGSVIEMAGTRSSGSTTSFGWAFLSRAMNKEELLSLDFSSLDLDSATQSIWRGDDGSGSTISDSGPLGNDATLSGTENTNWRWAPADSGDPSIAGQLIPELYGNARLLPWLLVDETRNRGVVARNPADIATGTIREGGVSISGTITSTGVVDITTPSKPVTVDTANSSEGGNDIVNDFLDEQWSITRENGTYSQSFRELDRYVSNAGSASIYLDANTPAGDVLDSYFYGFGGFWGIANDGRLAGGIITQPAPKHPYMDKYIQAGGRVPAQAEYTTGGSVSGWFLLRGQREVRMELGVKRITVKSSAGSSDLSQFDLNFLVEDTSVSTVTTVEAIAGVPRNTWVFFAIVFGATVGAVDLYLRPSGGAAITSSGSTTTDRFSSTTNFDGDRLTSWSDFACYKDAFLTTPQIEALYEGTSRPGDLGATLHAPMDSAVLSTTNFLGAGNLPVWKSPLAIPSGDVTLDGSAGADPDEAPVLQPEATYDLSLLPGATFQYERNTGVSSVDVMYSRGRGALSTSELGATVVSSERPELQSEWLTVSVANEQQEGEARKTLEIESPVNRRNAAFATGRFAADVNKGELFTCRASGLPRSVISLTPHAEVFLTDLSGQEWSIRVVSRGTDNPLDPDSSGAILGIGRML